MMEDKENNINVDNSTSTKLKVNTSTELLSPSTAVLTKQSNELLSPTNSESALLMVSPFNNNNNQSKQQLSTPDTKSPIPPPNSEHIQSAFKDFDTKLNTEVSIVNEIYDVKGTATKNRNGGLNGNNEELLTSSPESDCVNSPTPPIFPPYQSPKRSPSRSPMRQIFSNKVHSKYEVNSPIQSSNKQQKSNKMRLSECFRQAELTMNNEVEDFNLVASTGQGTATKQKNNGISFNGLGDSSPESDIHSPTPPVFPPYQSPVRSPLRTSVSPLKSSPAATEKKENISPNGKQSNITPNTRSSMDYSSINAAPQQQTNSKKSLFRISYMAMLNEDDSSSSSSSSSGEDGGDEASNTAAEDVDDTFNKSSEGGDEAVEEEEDEPIEIDLSTLNLDEESDDESVIKLSKTPNKRRVIDDDSDESSAASDEKSDASEVESTTSDNPKKEEAQQLDDLGKGLTGLNLDKGSSSSESEEEEEDDKEEDPSFQGGGGDSGSSFDSSSGEEVSFSSTESNNNNISQDDSVMMCFDACGCWELDEENSGDLYLSGNSNKWPKIRLPLPLYNKLFQHQRIGVQWMASLYKNEIKGGILADDMGMGKTMQTLAYLGSLMRAKTINNAIIVCPKSVVRSWEREANLILKNMCVPKASVYAVTSDMGKEKRKRVFADAFCCSVNAPRLVVTTYGLVSSHITDLTNIAKTYEDNHWQVVVLDEGHIIKNSKTKTHMDVKILSRSPKTRRLLLTGTPIQNNMKELHALFDFATSSKLLGSIKTFLNKYGDPIEEGRQRNASPWTIKKSAEMNTKLKQVLEPYFLQRLKKTTFEDTMPTKKELVVFTDLSSKQRRMYETYTDEMVFDAEMSSPLAAVSHLKMLCGHPLLIKVASSKYKDCDVDLLVRDSAKLQVLIELIQRLKRSGHKALIFSQSTKMLDIIERVLDSITYLRIDGSSAEKDRQRCVDSFNDPECGIDVMILSTKAAGVGLTLTGADRAIIYDPSWNPADDAQAVDRCYRIGQTKPVTVYRFIAAGTVEEKMYEKQVHKDGIKRVLLSSDTSTARYFDSSELKDLFKLAPQGTCATLEKFNHKSDNKVKSSFLTKNPSVVGVASHDALYAAAGSVDQSVDVDLTASSKRPSSEALPFSKAPYQKDTGIHKSVSSEVEDLTMDTPLKPLGGLNKTRQRIEDAKKERAQANTALSKTNKSSVESILQKVDELIENEHHGEAMSELLDIVENKMDTIGGDEKLELHKKVSSIACLLGWL